MNDISDDMPPLAPTRLVAIKLDERSIPRGASSNGQANIEHEREVAIFDILDGNSFTVAGADGPYALTLAVEEDRLVFHLASETGAPIAPQAIALPPFKRILKDYFLVCESYYEAIRSAPPARIQAIDVNRRDLHDEGSKLLQARLGDRITVDFDTARRLFTLLCALQWKG